MKTQFKNRLSERVMEVALEDVSLLDIPAIQSLQRQWTDNILKWHAPYIALLDLGGAQLAPEAKPHFERMIRMLHGFHMRKIGVYNCGDALTRESLVGVCNVSTETRDQAVSALKLDSVLNPREGHLPSLIRIECFFEDQFMEVSLARPGVFETSEDVQELRRRFEGLLRQWHTGYSVVFDCTNLSVAPEALKDFDSTLRFLKGFFCRGAVGHSLPRSARHQKATLPFSTYPTRHQALEALAATNTSGGGKTTPTCSRNDLTIAPG